MSATARLRLREVNTLDQDAFVAALGGLFEGPPWIVAETWQTRPFASLDALHAALCRIMYDAPVERQVALLRAHPDLVGRAALAGPLRNGSEGPLRGTLSPASSGEQAAAGLDRLTPDEIATFQRLNQEYRERFGFPFVICARENKKESILAGFASRIGHTREQEIATALGEVAKICRLRLYDTVGADESETRLGSAEPEHSRGD